MHLIAMHLASTPAPRPRTARLKDPRRVHGAARLGQISDDVTTPVSKNKTLTLKAPNFASIRSKTLIV